LRKIFQAEKSMAITRRESRPARRLCMKGIQPSGPAMKICQLHGGQTLHDSPLPLATTNSKRVDDQLELAVFKSSHDRYKQDQGNKVIKVAASSKTRKLLLLFTLGTIGQVRSRQRQVRQ
jgi:hypothetical protein